MLESVLLSLGGQVLGRVIGAKFGPQFGKLATDVVNKLGAAFGVGDAASNPDDLAEAIKATPEAEARTKIATIEADTAELVLARVELQKAENAELVLVNQQLDQEQKGPWFGWAWRPAWMWLLGIFWTWEIIGLHALNAVFKTRLPPIDPLTLIQLTALYLALYMGGHTVKDFVAKKWGLNK